MRFGRAKSLVARAPTFLKCRCCHYGGERLDVDQVCRSVWAGALYPAHTFSLKSIGHFSRLWNTVEESLRGMGVPSTAIGSLWSPSYYILRSHEKNLSYGDPSEGMRGWRSGNCTSSGVEGEVLDMAYEYLNWWLDGVPGAILARRGYHISVPEPLRNILTSAEWDYWYAGKPAERDLAGEDCATVAFRGEVRDGGSYRDRMKRVAFWSMIMPENNYLIRRWREFLVP